MKTFGTPSADFPIFGTPSVGSSFKVFGTPVSEMSLSDSFYSAIMDFGLVGRGLQKLFPQLKSKATTIWEDTLAHKSDLTDEELKKKLGSIGYAKLIQKGVDNFVTFGLSNLIGDVTTPEENALLSELYPVANLAANAPGDFRGFNALAKKLPSLIITRGSIEGYKEMSAGAKIASLAKAEAPVAIKRGLAFGGITGGIKAGETALNQEDTRPLTDKLKDIGTTAGLNTLIGGIAPTVLEPVGKGLSYIAASKGVQDIAEHVVMWSKKIPIKKVPIVDFGPMSKEEFNTTLQDDARILPMFKMKDAKGGTIWSDAEPDTYSRIYATLLERSHQINGQIRTAREILSASKQTGNKGGVLRAKDQLKNIIIGAENDLKDIYEGVKAGRATLGDEASAGQQLYSLKGDLNLNTGNAIDRRLISKGTAGINAELDALAEQIDKHANRIITTQRKTILSTDDVGRLRERQASLREQKLKIQGGGVAERASKETTNQLWKVKQLYQKVSGKTEDVLFSLQNSIQKDTVKTTQIITDLAKMSKELPASINGMVKRLSDKTIKLGSKEQASLEKLLVKTLGSLEKRVFQPIKSAEAAAVGISDIPTSRKALLANKIYSLLGQTTKASEGVTRTSDDIVNAINNLDDMVMGNTTNITADLTALGELQTQNSDKIATMVETLQNKTETMAIEQQRKLGKAIIDQIEADLSKVNVTVDNIINSTADYISGLRSNFKGQKGMLADIDKAIARIESRIAKSVKPSEGELIPIIQKPIKGTPSTTEGVAKEIQRLGPGDVEYELVGPATKVSVQVDRVIKPLIDKEIFRISRALGLNNLSSSAVAENVAKTIKNMSVFRTPSINEIKETIIKEVKTSLTTAEQMQLPEWGLISLFTNLGIRRAGKVLNTLGVEAQQIAKSLETIEANAPVVAGKWGGTLNTILNKLDTAQASLWAETMAKRETAYAKAIAENAPYIEPLSGDTTVDNALSAWKSVGNQIGKEMEANGVLVDEVPFKLDPNKPYFPHIHKYDELKAALKSREFIQNMAKENGISYGEAEAALKRYSQAVGSGKMANIEKKRTINIPGWEQDPRVALPLYIENAAKRLETIKQFGQDDKILLELRTRAIERSGDHGNSVANLIDDTISVFNGNAPLKWEQMRGFLQGVRSFSTASKLSLASISNAFQTNNSALASSVKALADGAGYSIMNRKKALIYAERVGAAMDTAVRDAMEAMSGGTTGRWAKLARGALDKFGFTKSEKTNRVFAANIGKQYILIESGKILKNPFDKAAGKALKELGIDPLDVIKFNGPTDVMLAQASEKILMSGAARDMVMRGSNKFTKITQFGRGALDLPITWNSEIGKTLTQFKNFSYNQSIFLYDQIIKKGVLKGNFTPLMDFMVSYGLSGEIIADIRSPITGKERPDMYEEPIQRYFENLLYAGGLGLWTDYIQAGGRVDRVKEFAEGPNIALVAGATALPIQELMYWAKVANGEDPGIDPALKFIWKQIPRAITGPTEQVAPMVFRE